MAKLAAQLATLPILLVAFGQISNVALLANLLVLPFVPLAMLLTLAAGVLGFGGEVAGWLLSYMVKVAAATWWMWRKTRFNLRSSNIIE